MTTTVEQPAVEAAAVDAPVTGPPPRTPGRPRQMLIGSYLASGAGAMAIAGLIGAYLHLRDATPSAEWPPPDVHYPNMAVLTLTLGLIMSAATAGWMIQAARSGDRRNLLVATGLTLLLGVAHVNGMLFVFDALGLVASESAFATVFYAVNGLHLAYLVVGMVALLVAGFQALGGRFVGGDDEPLIATVVLWQFVVLAWIAVYVLVFLVK